MRAALFTCILAAIVLAVVAADEDDSMVDALMKRSLASGRINYRPGKRSLATARPGYR